MSRLADPRVVPYPSARADEYFADGRWSRKPTAERFHEIAGRFGDRTAVIDQRGFITYEALDERSDQVAAAMLAAGIRPGDPILFQVNNDISAVVAWYAVLKAGGRPVATLAAHRQHEVGHVAGIVGAVGHIVDDSRPERFDMVAFANDMALDSATLSHIFTVGGDSGGRGGADRVEDLGLNIDAATARRAVEAVQADIDPQDVAVYQLSGGTTGAPKVIPRLHAEYWNNGLAWAVALGRTERTVTCHAVPFIHNAGISCGLHGTHSVGGCFVLAPPDRTIALRMMHDHQVEDTIFGHGMFGWILSDDYAAAGKYLRTAVLSGAKVPDDVFARVESFGARVGQTFGMGEGLFTLTPLDASRELRATTVGPPLTADDQIRILEPGGERELPDGETGELACRGWYTIPGYFASPDHNASAFTSDGFYRTGDLGRVHVHEGERYLSIEGRIKDLINRGGEKINAEELEVLLLRHPRIAEAAVVAMPDVVLGERVCAVLVASGPELTVPDLQAHLRSLGVAKFKWPERVETATRLPRTPVGKVDKKAVRADVQARTTAP